MTASQPGTRSTTAEALREAFDRSFAEAPTAAADEVEALLGIHVGGDAYAVRLGQISGLFADTKIVALPSPVSGLLGIVGLRGGLVPVFSMCALLGYAVPAELPRWILVVSHSVGLGFEQLDGQLRVRRSDLARGGARAHVSEIATVLETSRAVVDIPSLIEKVEGLARSATR